MSEFEAIGFEECKKFLKELDEKTNRKLLARSLVFAGRPFVAAAKSLAPVAERNMKEWWGEQRKVKPGTLKKSIGMIIPKSKKETVVEMYVGPKKTRRGMKKRLINDAWYRHMVIRGTAGYTIKKGTRKGEYMPGQKANRFMDKAYDMTAGVVERSLKESVTASVNSHIKQKGVTVR